MYSRISTYNKETNQTIVSYIWYDKDQIPHYADNCTDLISQIENEYNILQQELKYENGN